MTARFANGLGLLLCLCLLGYAYYAQAHLHLEPCPLCIFQRVGIAATGVLFLVAALHNPKRWGGRVYGVLIVIAADEQLRLRTFAQELELVQAPFRFDWRADRDQRVHVWIGARRPQAGRRAK